MFLVLIAISAAMIGWAAKASIIAIVIAIIAQLIQQVAIREIERNRCIAILDKHITECNRLAEKFSADEFVSEGYKTEAASLELVKKEINYGYV